MEMSGQLHALATFPPKERATSTHWLEDWMGTRVNLDAVMTKNSSPWWKLNPSHPVCSLVTIVTEMPWLFL